MKALPREERPRSQPTKVRILIVEDERDIADFVATERRFEGFDVRIEHDGMRGMVAARQDAPDLILLDRMLPGLDGLEFCRRIRSRTSSRRSWAWRRSRSGPGPGRCWSPSRSATSSPAGPWRPWQP